MRPKKYVRRACFLYLGPLACPEAWRSQGGYLSLEHSGHRCPFARSMEPTGLAPIDHHLFFQKASYDSDSQGTGETAAFLMGSKMRPYPGQMARASLNKASINRYLASGIDNCNYRVRHKGLLCNPEAPQKCAQTTTWALNKGSEQFSVPVRNETLWPVEQPTKIIHLEEEQKNKRGPIIMGSWGAGTRRCTTFRSPSLGMAQATTRSGW